MDQETILMEAVDASAPGFAGAPLSGEGFPRPGKARATGQRGCAAEIPLRRTVTGCVLMLESLVMALVRQITLKEAAVILRNCDSRLWRLEAAPGAASAPARDQEGAGAQCLNLFYDLETSFTIECGNCAVARAQPGPSAPSSVARKGLDADAMGFARAMLAAIEALVVAAGRTGVDRAIKKSCARGKVSAEAAMLCPCHSRAPPRLRCQAWHRGEAKSTDEAPDKPLTPWTACHDLLPGKDHKGGA